MRTREHVLFVENAFGEPAEEARHSMLQHLAARRKQRRSWRNHFAERDQVVFVATCAVQDQQRTPVRTRAALEAVNETELCHQAALSTSSMGGSAASISFRWDSRKGGSFSARPRLSTGSSTAKPG